MLRAEGYKDGKLAAVQEICTVGAMSELCAKADKTTVKADGLVQIELSALDDQGRTVLTSNPVITCEIEGPAHLIGMDAGDLSDLSLYSEPTRRMFHGLLLAVIMADEPGEVRVTFTAENGEKAVVTFSVKE